MLMYLTWCAFLLNAVVKSDYLSCSYLRIIWTDEYWSWRRRHVFYSKRKTEQIIMTTNERADSRMHLLNLCPMHTVLTHCSETTNTEGSDSNLLMHTIISWLWRAADVVYTVQLQEARRVHCDSIDNLTSLSEAHLGSTPIIGRIMTPLF